MFDANLIPIAGVLPVSHNELGPQPLATGDLALAPSLGVIPDTGNPPPVK